MKYVFFPVNVGKKNHWPRSRSIFTERLPTKDVPVTGNAAFPLSCSQKPSFVDASEAVTVYRPGGRLETLFPL